uniref:Pyr_redox_2 domain-containing protein n=1 Tax=Globodera pallida TaxID=36090 RepID=A0A183BLZ5_GLOPA
MNTSILRFSTVADHFRLVVVGGGTAGCAVASKFARILPKKQIAVIEPQKDHYYQPGLTLAAAGLMSFEQLHRDESSVLPHGVNWFQNSTTIEGLSSGTESVLISPSISSIYFPEGAKKTLEELNKFPSGGVALFTYPAYPIKSSAEEEFVRIPSFVSAPLTVGYLVCQNMLSLSNHNLVKVDPERRHAVFEVLNEKGKGTGERRTLEYSFLHIGPPCSPTKALIEHAQKQNANALQLTDPQGWVKVDPRTLQSPAFPNVFAIGDCANTPNAKTAAAVSSQLKALAKNLKNVMDNKAPIAEYDGYASCPLVVDRRHVVLAEFSPNGPMETFPYDQSLPT